MKSSYQARTGHGRTKTIHKNTNSDATLRRKSALDRLEKQLVSGKKTEKKTLNQIDLDLKDKERIKKEIQILKTKT